MARPIELTPTVLEADGDDWSITIEKDDDAPKKTPWAWTVMVYVGNGSIDWSGHSPTCEAAQQNAIGALDRLQFMMDKPAARRAKRATVKR